MLCLLFAFLVRDWSCEKKKSHRTMQICSPSFAENVVAQADREKETDTNLALVQPGLLRRRTSKKRNKYSKVVTIEARARREKFRGSKISKWATGKMQYNQTRSIQGRYRFWEFAVSVYMVWCAMQWLLFVGLGLSLGVEVGWLFLCRKDVHLSE